MPPSSRREEQASFACPAWVWSNKSNAHVAKDRSWFGDDYKPFASFFTDVLGHSVEVIGIGTVELPTKPSPNSTGPSSHRIVRLKHVLHVPSAVCNIIGHPILKDYGLRTWFRGNTSGIITSDDRPVAYFKPMDEESRFWELRVSGPPYGPRLGPSPLKSETVYMIHAIWPEEERERFFDFLTSSDEPLTVAENAWLRKNYGSEFKFLQLYGLSIYNEMDREEGRSIVRSFMHGEEDGLID